MVSIHYVRLTIRLREVSKPRSWVLKLSCRSDFDRGLGNIAPAKIQSDQTTLKSYLVLSRFREIDILRSSRFR